MNKEACSYGKGGTYRLCVYCVCGALSTASHKPSSKNSETKTSMIDPVGGRLLWSPVIVNVGVGVGGVGVYVYKAHFASDCYAPPSPSEGCEGLWSYDYGHA